MENASDTWHLALPTGPLDHVKAGCVPRTIKSALGAQEVSLGFLYPHELHAPFTMGVNRSLYCMLHRCIIGLALFAFTLALPSPTDLQQTSTLVDGVPRLESRDAKPFALRIMPLGASITTGLKSSDKNGYRIWIREQLRHAGWEVNMVGSLKSGTMRDNVSLSENMFCCL